ncbi:MAG: DUF3352 domain-containing protein [Acidobacteria bacterium]|nr:DUF3352 domain-containing protein [Acidobacteriota bacterium]MCL5286841.1 DUF3352 domain-containing protein [Acidobacteriota bacterium]
MSSAAFPNYGDVASQALKIFRQELKDNSVLRDWWEHGELAAAGPKVLDALEKFDQLHQYLGEEIVVSGAMEAQEPSLLLVAEIRKPGLKEFIQQWLDQLAGKSKPAVRVLDLDELAAATDAGPKQDFVVLVRPDYVLASLDLATLRRFNARLDAGSREFVATPFGQRAVQEYQGGLTILTAVDLREILNRLPPGTKQDATFQRTGFADLKYFVWSHKPVAGRSVSQAELSFTAPRHGIASWIANSGPLGSLDFVSPKASVAVTLAFKNPAQMFEHVKELAGPSNSGPFASLAKFEQALNLRLKDDLLSYLGGELTVELDSLTPPLPAWRAMLSVKDADRLQQTLNTILAAAQFEVEHKEEGGVTYHTVRIPSAQGAMEIGYSLMDGYLVVGASRDVVADAILLHRSGGSLAKSGKFLAALPPGHSAEASALLYLDPIAMTVLQLQRLAPELADSMTQDAAETTPAVVSVYGEDAAIRQVTTSPAFDAGAVLVVAAIAIPNLLRSRIAANEASAVGNLRSVNTAQVVYATSYPQRRFALNLAALGPDPRGADTESREHANLLDDTLANPSCTGEAWCVKSGYRFRLTAVCKLGQCEEYVVVAAPVTPGTTGTRSFCSTSDGVIRVQSGTPSVSSLSVAECKAWPPI